MNFGVQKLTKTASMAATSYVGDSPLFLLDYLLRLLRVAVLLSIWRTLFRHGQQVSGLTLPALLTYTIIAEAFSEQLEATTDIAWSFWDGTIATRFTRPLSVLTQYMAETCGKWAFNLVTFSLPLLLLAAFMGVRPLPANGFATLLFPVSLALGIAIGFALDFLFTSLAIGLQFPPFALQRVRGAVSALLSGAFIPLALLPWNLGRVFGWLPFASMASAPLRIYTGSGSPVQLIALQAFWAALLWPCALWLWRQNQERMVAYGG
jgi:ABC-2 type transport system permease protein